MAGSHIYADSSIGGDKEGHQIGQKKLKIVDLSEGQTSDFIALIDQVLQSPGDQGDLHGPSHNRTIQSRAHEDEDFIFHFLSGQIRKNFLSVKTAHDSIFQGHHNMLGQCRSKLRYP